MLATIEHIERARIAIAGIGADLERAGAPAVIPGEKRLRVLRGAIRSREHRRWLRPFAHDAIEAGEAIVHVQDPHEVRGVEVHRGAVVLYGLGDFVYRPHRVKRYPSDAYQRLGLPAHAGPDEVVAHRQQHFGLHKRETFEGVAAVVTLHNGRPSALRLLPIDLRFDAPAAERGIPRLAGPALGRTIVETIARRSRRYRTRVRYDDRRNEGVVPLE